MTYDPTWSGGGGGAVDSVNGQTGVVVLDTSDIAENTNLYWTQTRFDTALAASDTDDLSEGSTNLYYTEARVSANTDVTANTSARHDAVTLAGESYLSLSGQEITADPIAVGEIDATGTASSTTYLRGDGSWQSISASTGDQAAACFYDNAGGQTLTTTDVVINLDTTMGNSDTGVFTLASDVVTVAEAGFYLITYDVTASNAASTRNSLETRIQRDTGSGYADIDGSLAYAYARTSTDASTASSSLVIELTADDDLRIVATTEDSNGQTTVADGSRFGIVQLKGPKGDDGAAGQGVPSGGTASQVLEKIDGTDYNTQWATPGGGGAWSFVTSSTASTSNLSFTSLDQTADHMFVFENIVAANFHCQTSTDNGSTYDSGATDYGYSSMGWRDNAAAYNLASTGFSRVRIADQINASHELNGELMLFSIGNTTTPKKLHWTVDYAPFSNSYAVSTGYARRKATANIDAIQFAPFSGTLTSGTIYHYKRVKA